MKTMENKFVLLNNISYGAHERQKLDIFIPGKVKSDSGMILFIHGGGWVEGDKSAHHSDAEFFCDRGYITATMNYRYVSETLNVFDELDDITLALKTIKNTCADYEYQIEKMIVSGGSAGANLSLLYAYTRRDESPVIPVAACVYCPPVNCAETDFLLGISGEFENWKYEVLSKCCGCKITKETFCDEPQQQALRRMSPEVYLSADSVPTAVFHGKNDELVPIRHTYKFISLLSEKGISNDLLVYENSGHALDKDPETALQAKKIIEAYAQRYL